MIRTSCRLMLAAALVAIAAVAVAQETFTVSSVDEDLVMVAAGVNPPEEQAIFDVYRAADSDGVYRDLVDSVYFVSVEGEENAWVFRSVWTGGGRYVQEGDVLVPTPRTFAVDSSRLEGAISASTTTTMRSPDGRSVVLGLKSGLFLGSGSTIGGLSGFSGEFYFTYTGGFPLTGYVRGTSLFSNKTLFDSGWGATVFLPQNPAWSFSAGALFGSVSYSVVDPSSFSGSTTDNATILGGFLGVTWVSFEALSFGADLTLRTYAMELDFDTALGFDVALSAVFRIF